MAMPRQSMDDQWKINVGCFLRTCRKTRWCRSSTESSQKVALCLLKKWKLILVCKTSDFGFHTAHYRGHRTLQTICKSEMCFLNTQIQIFKYKYQINSPGQITWLIVMSQALVAVMLPCKNIVGDDDIDNYPWSNPWGWWQQQPIVKLGQIQRFRITNAGVENRAENTE